MNRAQLVDRVARRLGCSSAQAAGTLDAILGGIGDCIAEEGRLSLRGFGTFEARKRAPRRLIHPSSAEPIVIHPRLTVLFRPGATLLRRVRGGDPTEAEDPRPKDEP